MNQTNRARTATVKAAMKLATPTLSQLAVARPKAARQTESGETEPQPAQDPAACRSVHFELYAPRAWSVCVVGTFNHWKAGATPLSSAGGGKWATNMPLAPGRYEYRFVVDGHWVDDPEAKTYVPNSHGGRNAVLEAAQ